MALPFPHTSPLPAVPHKPHQPPTRKLGFASKDRCAHPPAAPLHPAEAAALALEPCRGRRPPPSPRLRPQGSSCEKQARKGKKVKERRRGIGQGGTESCTFLRAEQASPRRGPRPRSCLSSPGPPTRQEQHLLLHSPSATVGAAPQPGLAPECSMRALQVCMRGQRCTGTEPGPGTGFRWETPMVRGC